MIRTMLTRSTPPAAIWLDIINDILDLSKVEAGHVQLHEEQIDIAHIVRSCLNLVKERASRGGIKLLGACLSSCLSDGGESDSLLWDKQEVSVHEQGLPPLED